jgi:hypothetical protein
VVSGVKGWFITPSNFEKVGAMPAAACFFVGMNK